MKLSPVLSLLLWGACLLGFILPLANRQFKEQWGFQLDRARLSSLWFGLPLLLLAYLVAFFLKLEIVNTLLFAVAGFVVSWLLSCLNLTGGLAGIPLLLIGVLIAGMKPDPTLGQMPLLAYLFGLTTAKLVTPDLKLEDWLLPAIFCVGSYWVALSGPENWQIPYQTLLILALAIPLVLRGVQVLPVLPENRVVRGLFVVVVTGLLAWLGIQNLLTRPGLLPWVWLFAGGSLLAFLLAEPDEGEPVSSLRGAIYLILTGLTALIASRLFGTVGWIVVAGVLLSNPKNGRIAGLISLFFLARVLLQCFIHQFNPNVTGINITHPYAAAALNMGVVSMLLTPVYLASIAGRLEKGEPKSRLALALLAAFSFIAAGLANYFLHAEATGSFLTALTFTGLGVTLMRLLKCHLSQVYPLLMSVLVTSGCLLSNKLIDAGNSAGKPEKLWLLGGALILMGVLFTAGRKSLSRPAIPEAVES